MTGIRRPRIRCGFARAYPISVVASFSLAAFCSSPSEIVGQQVVQRQPPRLGVQQRVDHRALDDVVGEVEEEGDRRVPVVDGRKRSNACSSSSWCARKSSANSSALGFEWRGRRRRRAAHERARVGREPVDERLGNRIPPGADSRRPRNRDVLAHQRRQRKAQPRVVGDVVVTHDDRVPRIRRLEAEAQVAAHARRVAERHVGLVRLVERPHPFEQLVVAAFVDLVVRGPEQQQRLGVGGELLAAAAAPLEKRQQAAQAVEVRRRRRLRPRRGARAARGRA